MDILCFFGDSLVNGVGDPERLGWPGRLLAGAGKRGFAPTAYNLGVRGDTSRHVLARFEGETMVRNKPDAALGLIFSFGVADAVEENGKPRLSLDESAFALREVLGRSRNIGSVGGSVGDSVARGGLLVVGPLPVSNEAHRARLSYMDTAFADVCAKGGTEYLSVLDLLATDAGYMGDLAAGDGIHPGAAGYAAVARIVEKWEPWRALESG